MKYLRLACALTALTAAHLFTQGGQVAYAQPENYCVCSGPGQYYGYVYAFRNNPYYQYVWEYLLHDELSIGATSGSSGALNCYLHCDLYTYLAGQALCDDNRFNLTSSDWFEKDYRWDYYDPNGSEGGSGGGYIGTGPKYYCN